MRYVAAAATAVVGACLLAGPAPAAGPPGDPATACSALTDPATAPTGTSITSATLEAASGPTPQFCKVLGQVAPSDPAALPIRFEVNLPTTWNGRTLQEGGAGYEGTLVTGLAATPGLYPVTGGDPARTPLDRGYVTFGSDSGVPADGRAGLNDEELANFDGAAVKRTRDAAIAVVDEYYGRPPSEQYFGGSSKGGQEALVAAQRYPDDYDGVIAAYPASTMAGLVISFSRMEQAAYATPGGYLDRAKQTLLHAAVMRACDGLDQADDGIVADVEGCAARFDLSTLRCRGGGDSGDGCLSDAQIATLTGAASAYPLAFPLANGLTSVGGYPVLTGAPIGSGPWGTWWLSATGQDDSLYRTLTVPYIRYFVERDPSAATAGWDYTTDQDRLQQLSAGYDTTSPDLDAFFAHGGKLILVQGDDDMIVPESLTTAYYQRLAQRYGAAVTDSVRYYRQPGYGHGAGAFVLSWNALGALDSWVRTGTPPADPIATDASSGRTLPLCAYPAWPRYAGTGSADRAAGYRCVTGARPAATTTALSASAPAQVYGATDDRRVLLTATVTSSGAEAPAGTVEVRDGPHLLASVPLEGGHARLRLPSRLAVGAHALSATFRPSAASYTRSSSASVAVRVTKAASAVRPRLPARVRWDERALLRVTVVAGGLPVTGRVVVRGAGPVRTLALAAGRAQLRLPRLRIGSHRISVRYRGSATLRAAGVVVESVVVDGRSRG